MRTRLISALAAASVLAGVATPALAQSGEYREQLNTQLAFARALAADAEMEVAAGPFFGGLEEDATESFTLSVQKGKRYLIAGVCDEDCSDLDIRILNGAGDVIGEDELEDDAPVVELVPSVSGRVTIEVEMFACAAAPCYFAVEAYGD